MARPKTGREFVLKIAVDEQTYLDLLAFKREMRIESQSLAGFKAIRGFLRGAVGSVPMLLTERRTNNADTGSVMACNR